MIQLDIVIPCYNEEEALPSTHEQMMQLRQRMLDVGQITAASRIYYVDDGSSDDTWRLISELSDATDAVIGLRLSGNCGHQNAVLAGLFATSGDAAVSIDADLQDDINVIPDMVENFEQGHEIVYGVRTERDTDAPLKRNTALLYYRLLKMLGVDIVANHADFRLMSRRAISSLKEFSEVNLFLRGIVPMLGFKTSSVYYARKERTAGETKYSTRKMLALAMDGITSFSPAPLRLVAALGLLVFLFTIGMTLWVLWIRVVLDLGVPGWASSVIPIYFLGGIQLLCLGILGEYVAKMYLESKRRPRYFIAETTGDQAER
jgi:glycosyltransferase involved in cell wall biosynthesis